MRIPIAIVPAVSGTILLFLMVFMIVPFDSFHIFTLGIFGSLYFIASEVEDIWLHVKGEIK